MEGMIYDAVFASLFTYDRNVDIVQAFCEAWCPRTNTLVTSSGEMSISLRDLYMLGGLPLLGDIYDERIPNALDLNKGKPEDIQLLHLEKRIRNLDQRLLTTRAGSLKLLLDGRTMARGIKVCLAPPVLASIYYGLNSISESFSPGQIGTPFPIHYVYGWLAAYFNTHFKTPSLMLLSPKMVTSSGEGGVKHYDRIDARKRIFKGEHASWLCTSRQNGRDFFFCDDKRGARDNFEYFICLRPGFLVLRQGRQCKAEPYVPHRFSRQFGFYQASAPGLLLTDDRDVRLLRDFNSIANTYKAWLVDVHANLLETRVTDIVVNGDQNVTAREGITQDQRDQLDTLRKGKAPVQDAPMIKYQNMRPKRGGRSNNDARSSNQHSSIGEVEHSDSSESLNQAAASQQSPLPSNPPHKGARPEPSHVSILPVADSFMSKYMAMIAGVWHDICKNLKETPAESVSSFKGSVERQIELMKHNAVDLSSLENRVDVFFKKAEYYDKIRSQHLEAMPVETQVAELCSAQSALKDAQQKLSETQILLSEKQKILEDSDGRVILLEEAIKEAEKTITEAERTIKDSREELTRIHDERPKLQELVTEAQGLRDTSQEVVTSVEETVKRIQETPMLTSEDEDKLSLAEKDLEADKADLMNFRIV
nr:uncharacterized protein LOC109157656 [Ipomoea trifida]